MDSLINTRLTDMAYSELIGFDLLLTWVSEEERLPREYIKDLNEKIFGYLNKLEAVLKKDKISYSDVRPFKNLSKKLIKGFDEEIKKNGYSVLRPTRDHPHSGKTMKI
jgi:hypothetical protein